MQIGNVVLSENYAIVYGVGSSATVATQRLAEKGVKVKEYWETSPSRAEFLGRPVRHPRPTREPVLIASMFAREIAATLEGLGIANFSYFQPSLNAFRFFDGELPHAQIEAARSCLADEESRSVFDGLIEVRRTGNPLSIITSQYEVYRHPRVLPVEGDMIVDGGAHNGQTARDFLNYLGGKGGIVSFVPLERVSTVECDPRISLVHAALGAHVGSAEFHVDRFDPAASFVATSCDRDEAFDLELITVKMTTIDDYFRRRNRPIGVIKLDIEGAEREALTGARKVIREDTPRLIVCAYQLFDDLWVLPTLIKQLAPDYEIYLGHHTNSILDSIVYATP